MTASKPFPVANASLADGIIAALNLMLEWNDDVRRDLAALFLLRVPCHNGTIDHPTIQVGQVGSSVEPVTMGVMGLLNGLCGVIEGREPGQSEEHDGKGYVVSDKFGGWGFITAVWDDGRLVRFERTGANPAVTITIE